jgi:hypothetical protein
MWSGEVAGEAAGRAPTQVAGKGVGGIGAGGGGIGAGGCGRHAMEMRSNGIRISRWKRI